MAYAFRRELDRPPLRLAALFLVIMSFTNILNLVFLWSIGVTESPGYFYFQAVLGIFFAVFVFFGFNWAWGIAFTLYGYYIYRDISGFIRLWKQGDELQSMSIGVICFFVIELLLEILIVGSLFVSSYRMAKSNSNAI